MEQARKIVEIAEIKAKEQFKKVENIAYYNQEKVIRAFQKNRIALRHFAQTNGYGYGDDGRDTLNCLFADVFGTETALVSPHILSGTHALSVALFGVLRPNDVLLSITGKPYDTLDEVIKGADGSLYDFGIKYDQIDMIGDCIDLEKVKEKAANPFVKVVFLQRSRGYSLRNAISIAQIEEAVKVVRSVNKDVCIMVDNCYGEFIDVKEPSEVGADVIIGSLIKNPGGGIAPTGAYIAGKQVYIDKIAGRLTAPSIGSEVGSYSYGYQYFYQGLFLAPHAVSQAIKGSILFAYAFSEVGYKTIPAPEEDCQDIIRDIFLSNDKELVAFIQMIQNVSPIDSFLTLEPWDMPGYDSKVVMAAGCFVQGASLELSADSPVKPPYVAYLQGGITYEHCKFAAINCVDAVLKERAKYTK
ncbi:MAG: methionine gamma-lyase family protein [Clostridia bacterium]|nr:methionine gamma-lyase family protein [Clostridia bacterium]